MISFFHKIRWRLAAGDQAASPAGRFFRYISYAIGEILLIVIGILLALYLNNLNEQKNIKQDQIRILKELRSNLENTITAFRRSIKTEQNYLGFNQLIIDHLEQKKPYDTVLDKAFGTYYWNISSNPVTGAYDHLKSKGLNLIENDSLRMGISYLFESEFRILKEENQFWSNHFQENVSVPYHVRHFRKYYPDGPPSEDFEFARPLNYSELLNDEYFLNINAEIISNRKWNINSLKGLIEKIEGLKTMIDRELKELDK